MIKWFSIAIFCILILVGCATNSQPIPEPTSNTPVIISNPNRESSLANEPMHRPGSAPSEQFKKYDSTFSSQIYKTWLALLKNGKFDTRTGKVTVNFDLHPDGSVSDIDIVQNNVGKVHGKVCVDAIQKSVPFQKWPPEMVKKLGDHREITVYFDFYGS